MHLRDALYPTTANNWYLVSPSLPIKSESLNAVRSIGKYELKHGKQSAKSDIPSALKRAASLMNCPKQSASLKLLNFSSMTACSFAILMKRISMWGGGGGGGRPNLL
jgi:hypothetical protein